MDHFHNYQQNFRHHSISNVYVDTLDSKPSMLNIIEDEEEAAANMLLLDVVDEEEASCTNKNSQQA
jgi:hypothetical protein